MTEQSRALSPTGRLGRQPVWVKELGFTTLYKPENQTPVADVVFIHGLQGHPWRTWRYKGHVTTRVAAPEAKTGKVRSMFRRSTPTWEKKTQFGRVYWPAELLPLDQNDVRILTYGYDSRVTKWFSGASNQMSIEQHAASFLNSLVAERNTCQGRPIVCVVHSLGGLVLKESVRKSRAEEHHLHLRDLYDSIRGIIFFGTPHRGSKDAEWGLMLRNIANAALFDANDSILRDLEPHSGAEKLNQLTATLSEVLNEKDVCITSFQESQGKAGTLLLNSKVVSDESSALQIGKFEITDSINANHMNMCRFAGPDDDGYEKAKKAVSFHVERIKSYNTAENRALVHNPKMLSGENVVVDLRGLKNTAVDHNFSVEVSKSLYFQDINNRRNHVYEDTSESYSWIWSSTDSKSSFTRWLCDGRGVFWITGRPGSGKSTLVKYLINHLKTKEYLSQSGHDQDWKIMSFFFDFRAGKGFANNFEGLLRSLLLQIISAEPEILASIRSYVIDDFDPELRLKWSVPTLRSALQTALVASSSNICLFADGLDEYEGSYRDLVDLFKDVESRLGANERPRVKICLASRPEPVLIVLLNESAGFRMQDCNASSISLYVSRRLEPILETDAGSEVRRLAERTSKMAEGIFLWAILATDDVIEQWACGTPFFEIEKGLQSLPTDLDDMYTRILGRIKSNHRREGILMLYLATYAAHTLTVEQLYMAVSISTAEGDVSIERPTSEIISSFARRVSAYTCGLLDVSYHPRGESESVQTTHDETAEFGSGFSGQSEPDNPVRTVDVKPLHETVRTFLERSEAARNFFKDEATNHCHGSELWLKVCCNYFDISCTTYKIRGIVPGIEWVRSFSYRFPLHQYTRKNLGWHAYMFEKDSEQSSYPFLDPILTQEIIDLFDLGDQLNENSGSTTPLNFAARYGLTFFCREKIAAGADVNESNGTPLLVATVNGHERTVKMLLEHGACLSRRHFVKILGNLSLLAIKEIWYSHRERWQKGDQESCEDLAPLHSVVESGAVNFDDLIVYLIMTGEDINAHAGTRGTPLHEILHKGSEFPIVEKMRVLIRNGASVNADGPEGKPLDLHLEKLRGYFLDLKEYVQRMQLLIDHGGISDHFDLDAMSWITNHIYALAGIASLVDRMEPKRKIFDYMDQITGKTRSKAEEKEF